MGLVTMRPNVFSGEDHVKNLANVSGSGRYPCFAVPDWLLKKNL